MELGVAGVGKDRVLTISNVWQRSKVVGSKLGLWVFFNPVREVAAQPTDTGVSVEPPNEALGNLAAPFQSLTRRVRLDENRFAALVVPTMSRIGLGLFWSLVSESVKKFRHCFQIGRATTANSAIVAMFPPRPGMSVSGVWRQRFRAGAPGWHRQGRRSYVGVAGRPFRRGCSAREPVILEVLRLRPCFPAPLRMTGKEDGARARNDAQPADARQARKFLLCLDREIGRVENLADFNDVARVRGAALRPFHEFFF